MYTPQFSDFDASDYTYELPPEFIAARPAGKRTSGRLLTAWVHKHLVEHRSFHEIETLLPAGAMLVVNHTRVIAARLRMLKAGGGAAEVFLLRPVLPSPDPAVALATRNGCTWRCLLGGRRLLPGAVVQTEKNGIVLKAVVMQRNEGEAEVKLTWNDGAMSFAEILDAFGDTPLPPYIKRAADEDDKQRYQTVYAEQGGSVAAPTAGLHFSDELLRNLQDRGISLQRLTLHVGAGTFKPLAGPNPADHNMHAEQIVVEAETIAALAEHCARRDRNGAAQSPIVPVGTTSVRTLESLYWFGVDLLAGRRPEKPTFYVGQWAPYEADGSCNPTTRPEQALNAVGDWLREQGLARLEGETQLMILPGYRFQLCDALITNFHQPNSSLLLLVGAFLGRSFWRAVYADALAHNYRFLSYGDGSLLFGPAFPSN